MRSEGYGTWSVCLSVCLSRFQLASRTFIRPKNDTTYLAGHVDGHIRTNLSENSPLQSYSFSIIVRLCASRLRDIRVCVCVCVCALIRIDAQAQSVQSAMRMPTSYELASKRDNVHYCAEGFAL